MSQVMQYQFRLFGPRKDQTININGHPFVKGVSHIIQASDKMGAVLRVLSFYGAYARGTVEYDQALALEEEVAGGTDEVYKETESGPATSVRSRVRSSRERPTPQGADVSVSDAEAEARNTGFDSDRDGHRHAGVPEFPEAANRPEPTEPETVINVDMRTAILKLDPDVNSHWVVTGPMAGKPKLNAVEEAYGRAGITRDDVEAAIPGWTRTKAMETALEA